MSWVVFDYGGVISQHQPAQDVARLARVAGCPVADFTAAYWAYRLAYDMADLDGGTYWQKVASALGRPFTAG
ncbi:MAG: HAD family phosphatase, partial [Actinobacteria bacterium]|nr:HAD family phosphatase [Actinomycetota bacterium]